MVANGISSIWVKSLNDSSTLRKITDLPFDPDKIVGHITWSRDAKQLAFLARFTDEPFREQLGIVEIESGKLDFISGPVSEFAWSPVDSKLAAFPSGVDSAIGLYLIDPATDTLNRLCKSCYVESLAWSPDGKQIAFIGHQGNQPNQVIVLNVAKKAPILTVPQSSSGYLKEISWSPNGQYIAFCNSANSVLVLNVSSKNVKTVGERAYRCATWSPDGNLIAYVRDDISNDGKQQMNLVKVSVRDGAAMILAEVTPGVDKVEWR